MDLKMAPEVATQEDMNAWYKLQQDLAEIKDKEMKLRKKIFAYYFQTPVEGTNTVKLTDGFVMKGTYKIDRKPDEAILDTLKDQLIAEGVPVDMLIRYKPELVISAYKLLTDEQREHFDEVLNIKPGSPSLEIMKPKKETNG